MSVHRMTPLPSGPATGNLFVAEHVLAPTQAALQASSADHQPHEGLVLWLGNTDAGSTTVLACAAPLKLSGSGGVHITQRAVGRVARSARQYGLGVVAQVHSHPGTDTRHSDGDDKLILMPFEGMFSLVVARYGQGAVDPRKGAGLHQHQDGRWVEVPPETFRVVPALIGYASSGRDRA
jgi:hypothetical protein